MKNKRLGRIMFPSFLLVVLFAMPAVPARAVSAAPQDEAKKEEKDAGPKVSEICKKLASLYKEKRNLDNDAIEACFKMLDERFKGASKGDQDKIVKGIRKIFEISPLPDEEILKMAAGCLSGMGKKGKDALFHALKLKTLKIRNRKDRVEVDKKIGLKAFLIEAIGFNKNKGSVKELCKMLWDDETRIVIAACKALSCYAKLPLKGRKPIVQELVKVYANISSLSAANPKREDYRRRLIQVEVPFNEALRALTLRNFQSAVEWEKWYNNNKSKPRW